MSNQFKTIKKSGDWELKEFTVTAEDEKVEMMRAMFSTNGRYVPQGKYLMLTRGSVTVMSNTPNELDDHKDFIYECVKLAKEKDINVLIAGLGMGCVVDDLLKTIDNININIVELSQDVINITAPKYADTKNVKIIQGNIFDIDLKELPEKHYDIAWFDIWDYICGDNVEEFKKLRQKFSRKVKIKKFWVEEECKVALR